MKRNKKFIIIMATVATVLALTLSGVVFAEEENGSDNQPVPRPEALLDRACEIYEENTGVAIDSEELQNAFTEAREEMMDEVRDSHLKNLIDQGKITEEAADQLREWWESKPDISLPGCFGRSGSHGFPGGPRGGAFPTGFQPLPFTPTSAN